MASSKKAAKAQSAAQDAWTNPYVQRLVQDEELRDNLKVAYQSARSAYARVSNGKAPAKVVTDDKRFQKDVKKAGEALRDASVALKDGPKKKRRGRPRPAPAAGDRRRRARAGPQRGPAQQGPRRALRGRGGVRLHVDDDRAPAADPGAHGELSARRDRLQERAPTGRPLSCHCPATAFGRSRCRSAPGASAAPPAARPGGPRHGRQTSAGARRSASRAASAAAASCAAK